MNRLSGRWICVGRESGALELWDVAELAMSDTDRDLSTISDPEDQGDSGDNPQQPKGELLYG